MVGKDDLNFSSERWKGRLPKHIHIETSKQQLPSKCSITSTLIQHGPYCPSDHCLPTAMLLVDLFLFLRSLRAWAQGEGGLGRENCMLQRELLEEGP